MKRAREFEKDEMGAHARLYDQIAHSPAWLALGFSSRALYMQMRVSLKHTNNGNIDATLSKLKHAGFTTSSTLHKCLRELETMGLIAKTRQGGITSGGKLCNLYRFTDKPTLEFPKLRISASKAGHEWKNWTGLKAAEAAIKAAHAASKRPTTENEAKLQKSNRINSKSEGSTDLVDSKAEQGQRRSVRKPKPGLVA